MELDDIKNMDFSRGEKVEVGVKRPGFGHVGPGVFLTDRIGYFARIGENSREDRPVKMVVDGKIVSEYRTRNIIVTYPEISRVNGQFEGNAVETPVDQIEYIRRLIVNE